MIDKVGTGTVNVPDYSISWDSKSADPTQHGLEMQVINTQNTKWSGIDFRDVDGDAAKKLTADINGNSMTERPGEGYVRTVDGQSTANFGQTTFVDVAVKWSYLESNTGLAPGQEWRFSFGSIENATDHNKIKSDIAGAANPTSDIIYGWSNVVTVPEPSTILSLVSGLAVAGPWWWLRRRQKAASAPSLSEATGS